MHWHRFILLNTAYLSKSSSFFKSWDLKGKIAPRGQGTVLIAVDVSYPRLLPLTLYSIVIPALLNSFYIKSDSTFGIVHALLKWYSYLQYLQKQSLPSLAFRQTRTHTHARTPLLSTGVWRLRSQKLGSFWKRRKGDFFFFSVFVIT